MILLLSYMLNFILYIYYLQNKKHINTIIYIYIIAKFAHVSPMRIGCLVSN